MNIAPQWPGHLLLMRTVQNILMRISFLLSMIVLVQCRQSEKPTEFWIKSEQQPLLIKLKEGKVNYIRCYNLDSLTSEWPLRYPVFKFINGGDINQDGNEDLMVGVIKATRRDSIARKRLFLFQIKNKIIIPLWLGSSVSHPLEDFISYKNDSVTTIRTIEKEGNDRYLVADYTWRDFGLNFEKYIKRDLTLDKAGKIMNQLN
jgi:hypothetical protein